MACFTAIFGFFFDIIRWLVTKVFQIFRWVYSFDYVLKAQTIITYIGFIICFTVSKYWHVNIGSPIDSAETVAPGPAPHLGLKWASISDFWVIYGSVFMATIYYFAFAVGAVIEFMLVHRSDSLRLRQLVARCETLGQLRKTVIEISIVRLFLLIGDILCDPKEVDFIIFLAFVCAYLNFGALFKLIGIGKDFGWLDGLVSVMLLAFEHFVRPWSYLQILGVLLTSIVVCCKNTIFSGQGERLPAQSGPEEGTSLIEMSTRG